MARFCRCTGSACCSISSGVRSIVALPVTGDAAAGAPGLGAAAEVAEADGAGAAPVLRVAGNLPGFAAEAAGALCACLGAASPGTAGVVFAVGAGRWAHAGAIRRHTIISNSELHRAGGAGGWRPPISQQSQSAADGTRFCGEGGYNDGRNFTAGVYRPAPSGAMGERTEAAEKNHRSNVSTTIRYKGAPPVEEQMPALLGTSPSCRDPIYWSGVSGPPSSSGSSSLSKRRSPRHSLADNRMVPPSKKKSRVGSGSSCSSKYSSAPASKP